MDNNFLEWLEVICKDFDRARSLTVLMMCRYGEWDQLVSLRADPSDYLAFRADVLTSVKVLKLFPKGANSYFNTTGVDAFRFDYQITELLRKCEDLPTSFDRTQAAKDTFLASERTCALTNIRLKTLRWQLDYSYAGNIDPRWQEFFSIARKDVSSILGDIPDDLMLKLSPGSTFLDRKYILPQDKMSSRPSVTRDCWQIVNDLWSPTLWSRSLCAEQPYRSLPKFIEGNRFSTVPKTAKTDRGICIEPSLNVSYQLSVGSIIRKRLRTKGIDLKLGQDLHKRIVDGASMTLDVGSVDLSAASDSVSYELVKLLLPEDWFQLLDSLRSKYTKFEGKWLRNQKFSSMGNGYTFELETLIFFVIARTVARCMRKPFRRLSVYGDDILFDSELCPALIGALRFCGFETNNRKTFTNGIPFRESCGSDFYLGVNVRGYYVKTLPSEPVDWVKLSNGIRRMAKPDLDSHGDLYSYKRAWLRALSLLPTAIRRCRGPEILGDTVIHDTGWERNIRKDGTIQVLIPTFVDESYTKYDRRYWTRGSILSACIIGALSNCADVAVFRNGKWHHQRRLQKKPRYEPSGYQIRYAFPTVLQGVKTYKWRRSLLIKLLDPPFIETS